MFSISPKIQFANCPMIDCQAGGDNRRKNDVKKGGKEKSRKSISVRGKSVQ